MLDCANDDEDYPYWIPNDYIQRKITTWNGDVRDFLGIRRPTKAALEANVSGDRDHVGDINYGATFVRNPAMVSI